MTDEKKPEGRELDMDKCNLIGEWLCMAHVSERILMTQKIRDLVSGVEQGVAMLKEQVEGLVKKGDITREAVDEFLPMVDATVESFWEAVRGLERGYHVNASAAPLHYRFPVNVLGIDCVFGLPPNEHAMATDPTCTPRPWSKDPEE